MSLKYFHLVFIFLSTIFTLGFAFWCFNQGDTKWMVVGIGSALAGLALPVYGWFFLKKTKKLIL